MAEQTITLQPSESKTVSFKVTPTAAKTYQVSVDGLSDSFRASVAPVADIRVEDLKISPTDAYVGEKVTISVQVTNYGNASGTYTVKLSGDFTGSKSLTLQLSESKTVSFIVTPSEAKTYHVAVNGLSGNFSAASPEPFLEQSRGGYSELYVAGPSVAAPGQKFNIYTAILNWDFDNQRPFIDMTIYGEPVIYYDDGGAEGVYKAITPVPPSYEVTEYGLWFRGPAWKFSITMPDKPLNIRVDDWIEQEYAGIEWHKDATISHKIPLI